MSLDMETIFSDGMLTFVGQDAECIPPWLSRKYGSVTTHLDLSYNRIRSLKGLTGFDKLQELILDNNHLGDELVFPDLENLETLTLNKNNIVKLDNVLDQISEKLPKLKYLSLLGNQACPNQLSSLEKDEEDYQRYRIYVLFRVPQLKFLDSTPVRSEEKEQAARAGQYMKVVTGSMNTEDTPDESEADANYTPLPTDTREEGDHRGTYGKCRYVYYGRHSEGNRFIVNSDL